MVDPTDTQKDLVYQSEWMSPSYENNIYFGSNYDAKACFKSIIKSKVWANKFAVKCELKLDFDDDIAFAGRYWPSGLRLSEDAKSTYRVSYGCVKLHPQGKNLHILLHEMTHHVINERYPLAESHGPQFAWYLVAMVGCFFSRVAAEGLALSMKIHGVKAKK
jgi:hypothetical protein